MRWSYMENDSRVFEVVDSCLYVYVIEGLRVVLNSFRCLTCCGLFV